MTQEKPTLLLVEDDANFGLVLHDYLQMQGFNVTLCRNGDEGWAGFNRQIFDLCILDIMMPYRDGFVLAEDIRRVRPHQPLFFLTARSLKEDMLMGFRLGADDYITKPVDAEVLLYKIRAVLRRQQKQDIPERYMLGIFSFEPAVRTLTHSGTGEASILSPRESALLGLLCQYMNNLLRREEALSKIWGEDNYFTGRSMDVYMTKLRKRLSAATSVDIQNLHGMGYKLVVKSAEQYT